MSQAQRRRVRRASARAEKKSAAKHGGRAQPASGAFWGAPGDILTDMELIEHKMTGKSQITIKADWLEKNRLDAVGRGKRPVLQIELAGKNYFIYEEEDHHDIRERLRECRSTHSGQSG